MEKIKDGFVQRGEGPDGHDYFIIPHSDLLRIVDGQSRDIYLSVKSVVEAVFEKHAPRTPSESDTENLIRAAEQALARFHVLVQKDGGLYGQDYWLCEWCHAHSLERRLFIHNGGCKGVVLYDAVKAARGRTE